MDDRFVLVARGVEQDGDAGEVGEGLDEAVLARVRVAPVRAGRKAFPADHHERCIDVVRNDIPHAAEVFDPSQTPLGCPLK